MTESEGRMHIADVRHEGCERGTGQYRRVLVGLVSVGLTTWAQLYYPQSLIPAISRDLGVSTAQAALTVSGATMGLAVSVLVWAWAARRVGLSTTMKVAVLSAAVIGIAVPLCPSYPLLITLRVLQGAALGGTAAVAMTYLFQSVSRRDALHAAGAYISATTIGGLGGRLGAAAIGDVAGWRVGGLVVAGCAMAGAVLAVRVLPQARESVPSSAPRFTWRRTVADVARPEMLSLYVQAFLLVGAYVAVFNYVGSRLEAPPFDLPPSVTALVFLVVLAGTVAARGASRLAERHGRRTVLTWASAAMVLGALLTIPDWLPAILLGLVVITASFYAAHTIASGWAPVATPANAAHASSVYTLFYYAGASLLGWAGGLALAFGWGGMVTVVTACALLSFWLSRAAVPAAEAVPST